MHLEISQRDREGIVILDLKGRITAGDGVATLRAAVDEAAAKPGVQVILNLLKVDFIDSTGLGVLVYCATQLRKAGGVAKLVHLNRRNMELLVLTKINTIFEVFDDETEAVNSFFPDREIRRFDVLAFVRQMREDQTRE